MKLYGDTEKVEEYGNPNPNAVNIKGVVVVGYDPAINKWLAIKWNEIGTIWLVGGGHENLESYDQTAIRELKEETGYSDYKDLIQLGGPIISHYYNEKKSVFRRSYSLAFLFLLDSQKIGSPALEEHEKFTVTWMEYEALLKALVETGGGTEHWIAVITRARNYLSENKIIVKN